MLTTAASRRVFCSNPYRTPTGTDAPCRKCAACRARDAREWTARAKAEIMAQPETWFLTLTFRPGTIRHETNNAKDVTDYVKRLRKAYNDKSLRYFAAPEWGEKNGRLHYHILLHCSGELRKRDLQRQWGQGYSHVRLVRRATRISEDLNSAIDAAKYVAKYATKDGGRKRCSNAYGLSGIRNLIAAHKGKLDEINQHFPAYEILSVGDGWSRYPDRLLRKAISDTRTLPEHELHDHSRWDEFREIEETVKQSLAQQRGRILALTGIDAPSYMGWSTGRKIELLASVDRDPFAEVKTEG